MASQASAPVERSISTAASSTEAAPANTGRQFLLIQNLSDTVVYVRFGAAAVAGAAHNIYLAANGGSITFEGNQFVPSTSVNIIAAGAATSKVVTVLEA